MGGANTICSDKTGTLTMNIMTVTNIWAGKDMQLKVNDSSYQWRDYFPSSEKHINIIQEAVCCNTLDDDSSATEIAMVKMIDKFGVNIAEKRRQHLPHGFTRFLFSSKRKRMSTILENVSGTDNSYGKRIHLKGAAEIVLESCTHYLNQDGER
jgi:magnesium-transporting ATPase (P-type)